MQLLEIIVILIMAIIPGLIITIICIDSFIDEIQDIVSSGFVLFDLYYLLYIFFIFIIGLSAIVLGVWTYFKWQ